MNRLSTADCKEYIIHLTSIPPLQLAVQYCNEKIIINIMRTVTWIMAAIFSAGTGCK